MTTTARAHNADEMTAVNLADEHVEEATGLLAESTTSAAASTAALVHALLALGARLDALRETLNRELPDMREVFENLAEN
jgi:hypothetical protein